MHHESFCSWNEILCTAHIRNKCFKVALLHAGINDILKNRSSLDIGKLILDIKMIIDKCKSFGLQAFINLGLIFNRKVERSILE